MTQLELEPLTVADRLPAARGARWLSNLPAHWEVKRLKHVVLPHGGIQMGPFGSLLTDIKRTEDEYKLYGQENTISGDFNKGHRWIDEKQYGALHRYALAPGDLVVTRKGSLGYARQFPSTAAPGVADSDTIRLRPDPAEVDARFLTVLLREAAYTAGQIEWSKRGAILGGLNTAVIGGLLLALPPIEEQAAILTYLDRETARLDELVARKRQHLGLLAERRQALITRAVIRGLDPGAPLADSAVEWIGEIPAHWETARAKYVARLESGHTPSRDNPEYWEDCTIPWVTLSDVWQLRSGTTEVIRETKEKISELGLANSAARLLPAGTVILSRTASVGFSGILAEPMATTQDFVNWIPGDRISSEFLLQCFRAMRPEFDRLMMGSTHKTIYMPDVVKFVIPLPPPEEQAAIVQHIRDETARLDALVAKVKESIQRLREYRAALITAAVTGKIDVTV